jgi:flagellar motor switch protein FliN/FliY
MSDGAISQDEIDALLSGVDMGGLSAAGTTSSAPAAHIDVKTLTTFAEGLKGTLAESLKTMTGKEVKVDEPIVESVNRDQLLAKLPEVVVAIMADFSAGLSGDHLFILAPEFAQKLVSLINKEENAELDDMALSVISEVVSQHSGSEITALSKDGKLPGLATNPPEAVHQPKPMVRMPQNTFALFSYPVTVDGSPFTLWEAVSSAVADGMAKALGGGEQPQAASPAAGTLSAADMASMGNLAGGQPQMAQMGMMNNMGGQQMMQGMPNMGGMQPQMGMGMGMNGMGGMGGQMAMGMNTPNVQALQFPNLQVANGTAEQGNIGLIMDVQMEMTVELGRTKKTIKDILGMGEGTIIELDKLAGEPVDILVNHKPIAKGEVVVIDENFGVRVTEILPAMEHVASQM